MLEEEERDEDGKEESDGEVLIERPHRGPAEETEQEVMDGFASSLLISWRLSRNHSRREGDAGRGDNKNPVGSDQRGRVTCHHSQAEQELPRRGATRAPDTERLIGRKHLTVAPNVLGTGGLTGHKASAREEQPRRPGAASHRGPRQPTHHHNQGASA